MTDGVATVGRPRNPGVDARVIAATLELFGEAGWAGLSIEAVARRAGVGKASIYLRWSTKEELLDDALAALPLAVGEIDTGSVRGDLGQLVRQLLSLYLGSAGRAVMRLGLDASSIPEVAEHHKVKTRSQVLAARTILRRAIERRELPPKIPVTLLLDTLCGGAMIHAMSTPEHLRARVTAGADKYADELVGFLLDGYAQDF